MLVGDSQVFIESADKGVPPWAEIVDPRNPKSLSKDHKGWKFVISIPLGSRTQSRGHLVILG